MPLGGGAINPLDSVRADLGIAPAGATGSPASTTSFADVLKSYVGNVQHLEHKADELVEGLSRGTTTDVHQVMMAVEEANLALELLIQVRNRLLDAYNELSRTPL